MSATSPIRNTMLVGNESAVAQPQKSKYELSKERQLQTLAALKGQPYSKGQRFNTDDRAFLLLTGKVYEPAKQDPLHSYKIPQDHKKLVSQIMKLCMDPQSDLGGLQPLLAQLKAKNQGLETCAVALRKAALLSFGLGNSERGRILGSESLKYWVECTGSPLDAVSQISSLDHQVYHFFEQVRAYYKNPVLFRSNRFEILDKRLERIEAKSPGKSYSVLKQALIEAQISGKNQNLIRYLQGKISGLNPSDYQNTSSFNVSDAATEYAFSRLQRKTYDFQNATPEDHLIYDIFYALSTVDFSGERSFELITRPGDEDGEEPSYAGHLPSALGEKLDELAELLSDDEYFRFIDAAVELAEKSGKTELAETLRKEIVEVEQVPEEPPVSSTWQTVQKWARESFDSGCQRLHVYGRKTLPWFVK